MFRDCDTQITWVNHETLLWVSVYFRTRKPLSLYVFSPLKCLLPSLPPNISLRRSMSTHIRFEGSLKTISLILPSSSSLRYSSNIRYSTHYTNIKRPATQRQHSESFNGLDKRGPSSVDLLSTVTASSVSNNMTSRMLLQSNKCHKDDCGS
jgi:hypothetical protein